MMEDGRCGQIWKERLSIEIRLGESETGNLELGRCGENGAVSSVIGHLPSLYALLCMTY
jgi:hypothetical protein